MTAAHPHPNPLSEKHIEAHIPRLVRTHMHSRQKRLQARSVDPWEHTPGVWNLQQCRCPTFCLLRPSAVRAVAITLACPASFCTVTISAPRSSSSDTKLRRKSCGLNGFTLARVARCRSTLYTAWAVMRRCSTLPPLRIGVNNGPAWLPRTASQSSRASAAPLRTHNCRCLLPLPNTRNSPVSAL